MATKKPATATATPPEAAAPKYPVKLGGTTYSLRSGVSTWKKVVGIGPCLTVQQQIANQDVQVLVAILGHALGDQIPQDPKDYNGQKRIHHILELVFAEGVEPVATAVFRYFFVMIHGGKTIDEVLAEQKLDTMPAAGES